MTLDLAAIFGHDTSTPARGVASPEPAAPAASTSDPSGPDFSTWVLRPDFKGRLGWEPPDLPEAERWWAEYEFDDLPEADWTCPHCSGLLWWEDLLGSRHCSACEARKLSRSLELAERAARLRRQGLPARGKAGPGGETASSIARGGDETATDDTQHVDGKMLVEAKPRASARCEVGQEPAAGCGEN